MPTVALSAARLGRSARALLIGAVLVAAGAAWSVTGLRMAGMGGGTDLGSLGFYVGVWVVILWAAAYQLTPAKDVCLRRCRSPLHFFFALWRDGASGALRMGLEHGAWCVGCCWALMAALFALGAMSLGWMALVGALIAVEKLLPWRALANHGVAVVLVVLGVAVIATPANVPGLGPGSMSMSSESMSNGSGASMSQSIR
jgi:predicted metal-binding membrane protein